MAAAEVPTAMAHVCTTLDEVAAALDAFGAPHVVKDDGLAAGKGVVVTDDRDAALAHARVCLARDGGAVVVEEFLDGPEVSLFCVTDGHEVVPLAPAQDFKRLGDGDAGPNTGGMGAYSPLPWAPDGLVDEVVERVARPVVAEMARRGTPFSGLLYCGLALTSRGLRVIEFNARFGDPETQVVLARLATPLGVLLHAAATGHLAEAPDLRWHDDAAVTVVVAAHGYPGEVAVRRPDHRPGGGRRRRGRPRPARRDPARPQGPAGGQRRTGAVGRRHRRRPRRRPRRGLRRRRRDRPGRRAAPHRHRRGPHRLTPRPTTG